MAETADSDDLFWIDPDQRGILPLDLFHIPRRLRRTARHGDFTVKVDSAFDDVVAACAAPHPNRPKTWINDPIRDCYAALHQRGFGHSVEIWQDDGLVGGLYGVAMGAAFFGESMFSRVTDASKIALIHLVGRLRLGGFILLDTQFTTDHLNQFGAIEIGKNDYRQLLTRAIRQKGDFYRASEEEALFAALQSTTQTS